MVTFTQMTLFWDAASCSLVNTDRRFGGSSVIRVINKLRAERLEMGVGRTRQSTNRNKWSRFGWAG